MLLKFDPVEFACVREGLGEGEGREEEEGERRRKNKLVPLKFLIEQLLVCPTFHCCQTGLVRLARAIIPCPKDGETLWKMTCRF